MAANTIAAVRKKVVDQIWTRSSIAASTSRRANHTSAYDKNPDDHVHTSHAVPDELIPPASDKYWAPDPRTGVFGPAAGHAAGAGLVQAGGPANGSGESSVLEQKAWFRPTSIEDTEKPSSSVL